jgi:hypothetical protein
MSSNATAVPAVRPVTRSIAVFLVTGRYHVLNGFDLASGKVNEGLLRQLHRYELLADARLSSRSAERQLALE